MLKETFESIVQQTGQACEAHYGERLISLALFGSVARGTMRPDSDIDLLLVVEPLPDGRMARVGDFQAVEDSLRDELERAASKGIDTTLSPVIKTPAEIEHGSPLLLDMTDQARILVDKGEFLAGRLAALSARLRELSAKRVYKGGGYYWLLKPDLRPGEDIQL